MKSWWRNPMFWVTAGAIAFFVFYAIVLVFRHLNYFTAQYDLGNMDQVMWQALHGHWFQMVDSGSGSLISRFNYHADILLLGYLPFYFLAPHPMTLTILQLFFVISGVFPLFWFGRKFLPGWVAAIAASTLLIYPPLLWNILFDVHAVTLVIPLLIWAAWAATARRWGIFWICVALLPLAKEEVGITVALFGLIVAWKVRPRWIGVLTIIYGLGISALMLFVIIPHVRHSADHFYLQQYSEYGSTTAGVAKGILLHPVQALHSMFDTAGLKYLFHLIGPFGAFPVLAIPYIFTAGPEYAINTLSSFQGMQTIVFQYTSVLTPILLLSMVIGVARWWMWLKRDRRLQYLGVIILASSAIYFLLYDAPFPLGRHADLIHVFRPSPYRADIAKIKRMIHPNDTVTFTNTLGPQFSRRDHLSMFPFGLDQANVAVILFHEGDVSETAKRDRQKLADLKKDPAWTVVLQDNDLTYLRRKE